METAHEKDSWEKEKKWLNKKDSNCGKKNWKTDVIENMEQRKTEKGKKENKQRKMKWLRKKRRKRKEKGRNEGKWEQRRKVEKGRVLKMNEERSQQCGYR